MERRWLGRVAAIAVASILVAGCSGEEFPGVDTSVQVLDGVDFCRFRTFDFYDWSVLPGSLPPEPWVVAQSEIITQNEITAELEALGLRHEDGRPDLQINRFYFTDEETVVKEKCLTVKSAGGYGFWYSYSCGWLVPVDYSIGTVLVDLVDRQQDDLVFRGIAESTVEEGSEGDKLEAKIDHAMAEIFAVYAEQLARCPAG